MHTQILFKPGALSPADAMVGLRYPCVTNEEKRLALHAHIVGFRLHKTGLDQKIINFTAKAKTKE